jgi:hypothetical protein
LGELFADIVFKNDFAIKTALYRTKISYLLVNHQAPQESIKIKGLRIILRFLLNS